MLATVPDGVSAGQPLVVLQPTGDGAEEEEREVEELPRPAPRPIDLLFDGDSPRPEAAALLADLGLARFAEPDFDAVEALAKRAEQTDLQLGGPW